MRLSGCRNIFRHHPALIEWGCWRLFFPIAPMHKHMANKCGTRRGGKNV